MIYPQDIGCAAADDHAVLFLRKGKNDLSLEIIEYIVHWYKGEIICELQLAVNGEYPLAGFFLIYFCQGVEGDIVFLGSHVDQFFIIKPMSRFSARVLPMRRPLLPNIRLIVIIRFAIMNTSFISGRKQEGLFSGVFLFLL